MTGEDMGKKVLNPTIKYMYDYDQAQGGLLSLGSVAPIRSCRNVARDLDGLTLTPSPQLVVDNRYYGGLADSLGTSVFNTSNEDVTKLPRLLIRSSTSTSVQI